MPGWVAAIAKWGVAAAVAVTAVTLLWPLAVEQFSDSLAIGSGDDDLPEVEAAMGPPALEAGRSEARTHVTASLGTVEAVSGEHVHVGPGGSEELLVGFEPLPADPACLAGVALEMFVLASTETEVEVLPARLRDLGEFAGGQALPANHTLGRDSPSVAFTDPDGGWLRWDVTGAYALAARESASDAPVPLSVRLPDDAAADDIVDFATLDDPEGRVPRLRWAAVAGCEEPGGDEDGEDGESDDGDDD